MTNLTQETKDLIDSKVNKGKQTCPKISNKSELLGYELTQAKHSEINILLLNEDQTGTVTTESISLSEVLAYLSPLEFNKLQYAKTMFSRFFNDRELKNLNNPGFLCAVLLDLKILEKEGQKFRKIE